jgi:hypothetical protein
MYFDDVQLVICNTHCENQILNGGFEVQTGTEWLYDGAARVNPAYTTRYFHTGAWSMMTGIPIGGFTTAGGELVTNLESFVEVWQRNITLPDDHSGALLTFWILRTRQEGSIPPPLPALPAQGPAGEFPAFADTAGRGPLAVSATPEEDWVYLYILDDDREFLAKPLWQRATNDSIWIRYSFDLSDYMGQQIEVLFGTYNDGRGGPAAMFIDDVVVGTCE